MSKSALPLVQNKDPVKMLIAPALTIKTRMLKRSYRPQNCPSATVGPGAGRWTRLP